MRFSQLVEERPGKAIFGESGFKLVLVFEFFTLLGGHVGFEKGLAWIVRLGRQGRRGQKEHERGEQDRPDSSHGGRRPDDNKRVVGCNETMGHQGEVKRRLCHAGEFCAAFAIARLKTRI